MRHFENSLVVCSPSGCVTLRGGQWREILYECGSLRSREGKRSTACRGLVSLLPLTDSTRRKGIAHMISTSSMSNSAMSEWINAHPAETTTVIVLVVVALVVLAVWTISR